MRDGVNLDAGTLDVSAGKLGGVDRVVNKAEATAFGVIELHARPGLSETVHMNPDSPDGLAFS